ncbi:Calcium-transporting ATPase 9, plasma membrane-type [Salvia divinorum]|uniref:Calcium-transporting ATPase 9, plasma membrane-type n=1 Tax=Salvia divinorum TaxID=28513 RepID=A0ABD1G2N5_SALDI
MASGDEDDIFHDIESGVGSDADEEFSDPFDIGSTKNASHNLLKRWRQAALVLNASRRFRYTLDLKRDEEHEKRRRMIRAHAQVIRVKGISAMLRTDFETGISGDDHQFAQRGDVFGSNTYPLKKGRTYWMFLCDAWQDTTLIILIVAAIASLGLGIKTEGLEEGWYDGGSITFAVLLVIIVTATSDYRQSLQFQNLNEEKRNIQVEVIRGGRREKVSIYDIVVGDVIPLKIGDQVPADGLVTTSHSLAIDESSMTGESKIIHKDHKAPFLMSGCKVADGAGTMLVTGVGINTEWGLLMTSISEDNGEETPLQVRLNGVTTFIGLVGLTVAFSVLVILLARYFTGTSKDPDGTVQFVRGKTSLGHTIDGVIHIITAAVTIVVVAVPEGLPLAVTLTLAYSMKKMMADKALVRRLSACETMGSATTICSDKTGTLTLNQMTVVEAYVGKKKIVPPEDGSQLPASVSSLVYEGLAQNTSGSVFLSKDGEVEVSGSPTEKAILQWGVKLGMKFDTVKSESIVLHVAPFNSTKKRGVLQLEGGLDPKFMCTGREPLRLS